MRKEIIITTESVEIDKLNRREKEIYYAGYEDGKTASKISMVVNVSALGMILAILIFIVKLLQ